MPTQIYLSGHISNYVGKSPHPLTKKSPEMNKPPGAK
jgi:hypothetical protein